MKKVWKFACFLFPEGKPLFPEDQSVLSAGEIPYRPRALFCDTMGFYDLVQAVSLMQRASFWKPFLDLRVVDPIDKTRL